MLLERRMAYRYAGLVDKGWEIFEVMERDYSLKLPVKHYVCMADLLCHFGNIAHIWEVYYENTRKSEKTISTFKCLGWFAQFMQTALQSMGSIVVYEYFKLCLD